MPEARGRSQVGRNRPGTIDGTAVNRPTRAGWWRKVLHSTAAFAGLFAADASAKASSAVIEDSNYRSAAAAPETWQTFARQVRARFEQQLAGDDEKARRLQDYMSGRENGGGPAMNFTLRAWVQPDGRVSRVEFEGVDDAKAIGDLRGLLTDDDVGAPPPDMLQPLNMRLSLQAKDPARQGE